MYVIRGILAILFLTIPGWGTALAQEPHPSSAEPFIAGFDRFGRHGEIDERIAGKLLAAELSCSSCHPSSDSTLASKTGPLLHGLASRVNLSWIEQFVASPHTIKPGTTMPDVLGRRSQVERERIAHAITAYLSTQDEALPEVKASGLLPVPHEFWNKGNAQQGKVLFHRVGCVACHPADADHILTTPPDSALDQLLKTLDPEELAERGMAGAMRTVNSIPLGNLTNKYNRQGLTAFLLDPTQFRPAGRMPSLKLSPMEGADLVAYLTDDQFTAPDTPAFQPAEIAEGRKLFTELKCVNCHATKDTQPSQHFKPFADLLTAPLKGCLSNADAIIRYQLDEAQTAALVTAIDAANQQQTNPAEDRLRLQFLSLNCYACHERDGLGGVGRNRKGYFETVGNIDLGDEGRLPPPLTGVGRKLHIAWTKNVLQGKKADVRPHMHVRMPIFGSKSTIDLPELLAQQDTAEERTEREVFGDLTGLVEAGRQLMDVGCVQCHQFGGSSLPGVVGVDIQQVSTRIRPQWFADFLRNPGAIKNRTRMPTFFPDGQSQRSDLLDGDPSLQIAAMWAYLKAGGKPELPDKIKEIRAQNYELKPQDSPILLRTFMQDVGTHAIALGFPQQVHYAFDAKRMRLALAWRGRFLDAQGTWFVRSAPPASPLGEAIVHLQSQTLLAPLADAQQIWPQNADQYRFKGFRLDKAGIPTLLYSFDTLDIEDRITPGAYATGDVQGLHRSLSLRPTHQTTRAADIWMLLATGKSLTAQSDHSFTNEAGVTISIAPRGPQGTENGGIRQSDGRSEWILPIRTDTTSSLEIDYRW
jgi:cytochrome c2